MVLRVLGAQIGRNVKVYPSARIWAPWNLTMEDGSVLGDSVDCYCVAKIILRRGSVVSQRAFLCAATREVDLSERPLVLGMIEIGVHAWVAAEAFVGPGVRVADKAVVAARAVVFSDVPPRTIVSGNPARVQRTIALGG